MELKKKKCKPCEGGIPRLSDSEIEGYMKQIGDGWKVTSGKKISKEYAFVNYKHTMVFVNRVADLAEEEGHHPDMHVHYGKVIIDLWTHAINGLSENDFILASKIDELV